MSRAFLIKNGNVVAVAVGAGSLKRCVASTCSTHDALNAEFPAVLVNSSEYRISRALSYQNSECEQYARQLDGGRPGHFLIV